MWQLSFAYARWFMVIRYRPFQSLHFHRNHPGSSFTGNKSILFSCRVLHGEIFLIINMSEIYWMGKKRRPWLIPESSYAVLILIYQDPVSFPATLRAVIKPLIYMLSYELIPPFINIALNYSARAIIDLRFYWNNLFLCKRNRRWQCSCANQDAA